MKEAQHYHGYKLLQNQPCVLIKIEYKPVSGLDIAAIEDWMQNHLALDASDIPVPDSARADTVAGQAAFVFSRALALYGEFLTIVGIPCFKSGRVVAIEPVQGSPPRCGVTLALQVMDNLPLQVFGEVFRDALDLVLKHLTIPPERERAEAFLKRVQEETIAALVKKTPYKLAHQSILDMAYRQNVPYRHVGLGIVRMGWGSRSRLLRVTTSDGDSDVAKEICANKQMTARMLRSGGFPGAENILVPSADEAVTAANALGWPVVVKPPHRERSEGVTTNIRNEADLVAAYKVASHYDPHVLIERHADGDCHRIFVANDTIIYAVRRMPKGVEGDGRQSVAELVGRANLENMVLPPWRRLKRWPLDDLADAVLARQGMSRDSVPEAGQRVRLREISSFESGGMIGNFTAEIHPDNARLALEVTRYAGMSICGVDLITTDITRPWHETGAIINELNFQPEFRWWDREDDSAKVIAALIEEDGRIPVHVLVGDGDLLARARELKEALVREGLDCHLTTANYSEDGGGGELRMPHRSLFARSLALVMRPSVDALVIAGTQAELLGQGFAVDSLASLVVVDADERRAAETLRTLQAQVAIRSHRRVDA